MKKLTKKYLQEQYTKELASGMFWERFPEYTGDFEKDAESYKKVIKFRLNVIAEQEHIENVNKML